MSGLHTRGSLAASDPSSRWWLWDHIADSLFYTATNIVYAAPFFFYLSLIGVLFELTWECVLTFFFIVTNRAFTLCLAVTIRPTSVLRCRNCERFGRWFIKALEKTFPLLGQGMACGGFGKAPQTGEAEGLLTSSGNATHFSRGEEPWVGWADVAQMSLHTRTLTHTPTVYAHSLPAFIFHLNTKRKRTNGTGTLVGSRLGLWVCTGVNWCGRQIVRLRKRHNMAKRTVLMSHSGHIWWVFFKPIWEG